MNTNILKLADRNTFECIYIDFGLDAKDFETFKNRHEDNFNGLTFRDAKKQIIKDVFTDKKQIEKYLNNYKHDYFISLGDLGLTPKQVHVYGGKNELSGFVSTYNDKVKYYLNRFTEQISSGTKEQIKTVIDYYYKNQKEGTNESFISYLKDLLRKVEKGTYSRGLIDINGALVGDIVDGFAMSRAKRLLIGKLNKKMKML